MSGWSAGSTSSSGRRWPHHRRSIAPPAARAQWLGTPIPPPDVMPAPTVETAAVGTPDEAQASSEQPALTQSSANRSSAPSSSAHARTSVITRSTPASA